MTSLCGGGSFAINFDCAAYFCIEVFSETDQTEDLKKLEQQFQRIRKKAEHDGNHAHAEPPELC